MTDTLRGWVLPRGGTCEDKCPLFPVVKGNKQLDKSCWQLFADRKNPNQSRSQCNLVCICRSEPGNTLSGSLLFQSHQARIATLYLPLFGLLIENVQRINVRDVSPFPVNPGNVRKQSRGLRLSLRLGCCTCVLLTLTLSSGAGGCRERWFLTSGLAGSGCWLSFAFASVPTWRSVFVSPPPFLFL